MYSIHGVTSHIKEIQRSKPLKNKENIRNNVAARLKGREIPK